MKKYRYLIFLAVLSISFNACQEDVLDKKPMDKILEPQVWSDANLLDAYVRNLYSRIQLPYPYNTFHPAYGEIHFAEAISSDEALTPHNWHGTYPRLFGIISSSISSYMDYWDYGLIRDMNTFIENSEKINSSVISDLVKKQRVAEVRLLRVYTYFELVKRYGGVPLITKVQSLDDPKESLLVKRDKEQAIYDFIASEIDAVLEDLPTDVKSLRLTKWAALALKSRAMLYAGSIAKYGQVQLEGITGIPQGDANKYFNSAYEAAKALIPVSDGGTNAANLFNLYKADIKAGDMASYASNYYNMFNKENTSESIFEKHFISIDLGHALNFWENNLSPTYELVNEFEMIDGSSAIINFNGAVVANQSELWAKKEPRFHATVRYDQQPWFPGDTMYTHNYVITLQGSTDVNPGHVFKKANGKEIRGAGNYSSPQQFSPFWRKKMAMPIRETDFGQSAEPAVLFRLGEIYLNLAEAAYELGKNDDALWFTNKIRERAGVSPLNEINMDKIRHERKIELVFEGHRFWDMKRWRIAHKTISEGGLNGKPLRTGVYFDLRDNKYHFFQNNAEPNPRVFKSAYYYMPLTLSRTTNNPNLIENPGY